MNDLLPCMIDNIKLTKISNTTTRDIPIDTTTTSINNSVGADYCFSWVLTTNRDCEGWK